MKIRTLALLCMVLLTGLALFVGMRSQKRSRALGPESAPASSAANERAPARLEAPEDPARESPATPAPPRPRPTCKPATPSEQAAWAEKYAGLSLGEFTRQHGEFTMHLVELANPCYEEAFRRGDFDVVGDQDAGPYRLPKDFDQDLLTQIRMPSRDSGDRRVLQITLREEEHPELYVLQREELWLRQREHELERIARTTPIR
jgi:hypothetical protein